MKRIFTFLFFVMAVMTASAKVYTDSMSVAMSGSAFGKQLASIDLSQQSDGTYQMQITNLVFSGFAIGNITLPGVTGSTDDQNVTTYTGSGTATITEGTDTAYAGKWMGGSLLKEANVSISEARSMGDKLYMKMQITISLYGMSLPVDLQFGDSAATTNIARTTVQKMSEPEAYYSINGSKVTEMQPGQVYIVRMKDGTDKKIMK